MAHGGDSSGRQHDKAALPVTPAALTLTEAAATSNVIWWKISHMTVGRTGDKHRRHRQVDRGAIEVERIYPVRITSPTTDLRL